MTEDPPITDFVDHHRSDRAGRRSADRTKCEMHDFIVGRSDNCFDVIKQTIKDAAEKNDHRFEMFETRLQGYMTKWTVGVIILICSSILGVGGAFGLWQLKSVHEELIRLNQSIITQNQSISALATSVAIIATKQEGVLLRLEEIAPEHRELMEHMGRDK